MKSFVIYIKGHKESEKQAAEAIASFERYGWSVELKEGLTPNTVEDIKEYKQYSIVKNSRLLNFKEENYRRYLTKVSCAMNHIRFFQEVIDAGEPMIFLEHDALCTTVWEDYDFEEYLLLNSEHVFRPPNKLGLAQFRKYIWPGFGVKDFPTNYPLTYYRENIWKGSHMAPGTGAYAITPAGAKKMLLSIEKYGYDQSDFMINSSNVRMQYVNPSPVRFNKVNLSTSYGV